MEILLGLGAAVNSVDSSGLTALDHAVRMITISIAKNIVQTAMCVTHDTTIQDAITCAWNKVTLLLRARATFGPNTRYSYKTLLRMARKAKIQEAILIMEDMMTAVVTGRRHKKGLCLLC